MSSTTAIVVSSGSCCVFLLLLVLALALYKKSGKLCAKFPDCPVLCSGGDSAAPGGRAGDSVSAASTAGCEGGTWKSGGALSFYDVLDPKDGSGSVAGMDGKPSPDFFKNVNVVSVQGAATKCKKYAGEVNDWKSLKHHDIEVRLKGSDKTFRTSVWDFCSDCDCGSGDKVGCCTRNRQTYTKPGFLLDLEINSAKRLLPESVIKKGVVEVDYRVCPKAFDPAPFVSKYSGKKK